MNSLSVVVLLVALAAANAGIIAGLGAPVDSAAVVAGPSGTVVRSGLAAAPLGLAASPLALARTAYAPAVLGGAYAAPAVLGSVYGAPLAYAVPAGSGLEGQWIPDINEKLYDDGSYKPQIYGL